jgi:SAM-dependent methyltransferase
MVLYLRDEGLLDPALRVLHFAPEDGIWRHFRRSPQYVTADLEPGVRVMKTMSVESLPFADASFDLLICSHVLEHVTDDRRALAEFRRVLGPEGRALLQHPVLSTLETTREDPTVTDPKERERLFWQDDHVRLYGRDFVDRVRAAGFDVEQVDYRDRLSDPERERYAIFEYPPEMWGGVIFDAKVAAAA